MSSFQLKPMEKMHPINRYIYVFIPNKTYGKNAPDQRIYMSSFQIKPIEKNAPDHRIYMSSFQIKPMKKCTRSPEIYVFIPNKSYGKNAPDHWRYMSSFQIKNVLPSQCNFQNRFHLKEIETQANMSYIFYRDCT